MTSLAARKQILLAESAALREQNVECAEALQHHWRWVDTTITVARRVSPAVKVAAPLLGFVLSRGFAQRSLWQRALSLLPAARKLKSFFT
jgi:hypothetical protein